MKKKKKLTMDEGNRGGFRLFSDKEYIIENWLEWVLVRWKMTMKKGGRKIETNRTRLTMVKIPIKFLFVWDRIKEFRSEIAMKREPKSYFICFCFCSYPFHKSLFLSRILLFVNVDFLVPKTLSNLQSNYLSIPD